MKPIIRPVTKTVLTNYYQSDLPLTELNEQTVLILAPHVDDETIGLGGTIAKYKDQVNPATIHVCFMTDGAGSVSDASKDKLIAQRKQEAEQVKQLFNIDQLHFLDEPDGNLTNNKVTQNKLDDLITQINPDIIYCTTHVDCHPDHIAAGDILASTMEKHLEQNQETPLIRAYEINTAIPKNFINTVVDITKYFDLKTNATEIFQSQAIDFDGLLKISEYQVQLTSHPNVKYVEVFRTYTAEEWIDATKRVSGQYNYQDHFKQMNKEVTLLYAHKKNLAFKEQVFQESLGGMKERDTE